MEGEPTFGAWLKSRRYQLDLTQKGLAHQVGCSVGTIRKMEADERRPSRQLAGLLAECLEIPSDQHEVFIAFARSEPYISDTPLPVLPIAEDQVPIIPQEIHKPIIKHNLPLEPTPFVGREEELDALDELLDHHERRLVTILGPGGIGKTRLGIACAERQLQRQDGSETHPYKDGVYFVDLAPIKEAERLVLRLAETFNLRILAGAREERSPMQQLLDYMQGSHLLLVLDNFEHLLPPVHLTVDSSQFNGARLVAEILGIAPQIRILVTSRERLNLHAEQVYPIQGLTFPDWEVPEDAVEYSAMKLFIQTAQSVQPDFVVAEDDLPHLTQICRMVEGMPLGLELAAAWMDVLSLVDIVAEIQQSFDILETELQDVPDRHRSIRATFESSWRKLDEKERLIFSQLSVFQGGFRRDAAQAVTGATLRQMSRLVNKSLIQFDKGRERYQVHELLRQYGAERLRRDPELDQNLRDRHSSYYCQWIAKYSDDLKGAGQPQALSAIEVDLENVRLAWKHAIDRQDLQAIGVAAESLHRFYQNKVWLLQGVWDFETAVDGLQKGDPVGEQGIILGWVLAFLGRFYNFSGQPEKSLQILQESRYLLQRLGARKERLYASLFLLNHMQNYDGLLEQATPLYQDCLVLARELDDQWAIGDAQASMGGMYMRVGDFELAERTYRQSLEQMRKIGDVGGIAALLCCVGSAASRRGRYQEGLSLVREGLSVYQKNGYDYPFLGWQILGRMLIEIGEYEEAKELYQQHLALSRERDDRLNIFTSLFGLGRVAYQQGNYTCAERHLQESLELAPGSNVILEALGRLYTAQGDFLRARQYLRASLKTSIQLNRPPLLLSIFASAAELFAEEGDSVYAANLATVATNHSASTAEIKKRAEVLLTRLEAELSLDLLEKIRQDSQKGDLDSLAAQLVIDIEK